MNTVNVALPHIGDKEHTPAGQMCSASMDAWFADVAVLTDEERLLTVMREAAAAGGATVWGRRPRCSATVRSRRCCCWQNLT